MGALARIALAAPTKTEGQDTAGGQLVPHLVVTGPGFHLSKELRSGVAYSIGRDERADIRIPDDIASRAHATLHVGEILEIEDLGSANGTRVGTIIITPKLRVPLPLGVAAIIGKTTLVVRNEWVRTQIPRVHSHGYFYDRLIEECARAQGKDGPTFALVRLHADGEPNALVGAVAQILRPGDLLADYAPHELEILLIDSDQPTCQSLADRLREAVKALDDQARAGMAFFGRDGVSPGEIMANACALVRGGAVSPGDMVAHDPAMREVLHLAERAAKSTASVLILGETGVGKSMLARAIHRQSARASKEFIAVNCAAIAQPLLDAELFGVERGAFTGAVQTKIGLLEAADGSTLFLDEVGEMSSELQAKLLTVLQDGEIRKVGSPRSRKLDIRVVAATHRNVDEDVEAGLFRKDLYYRLAVLPISMPALRERRLEIEPLARRFLLDMALKDGRQPPNISAEALALLKAHTWPGNIRELQNVVARALAHCDGATITPEHVKIDKMRAVSASTQTDPGSAPVAEDDALKRPGKGDVESITKALTECANNQTRAAELLGVSRRTLCTWIKDLKLPRPRA